MRGLNRRNVLTGIGVDGANISHGPVLAALAVVGVLGLEIAKPLALAGALEAANVWRLGRALALGLLAVVAILFSITSELSLIARSRADATRNRIEPLDRRSDRARQRLLGRTLRSVARNTLS